MKRTKILASTLAAVLMTCSSRAVTTTIFSDDFSQDASAAALQNPGYTAGSMLNPSPNSTNTFNWSTATGGAGTYHWGLVTVANEGFPGAPSDDSNATVSGYLSGVNGMLQTPILDTGSNAITLNTNASYDISLDVGTRNGFPCNAAQVDLIAGSTVLTQDGGSETYSATFAPYTLNGSSGGRWTSYSFTIQGSVLAANYAGLNGDALSIGLLNTDPAQSQGTHFDFTNIQVTELTESVPEPATVGLLILAGACCLIARTLSRTSRAV